MAEKLFCHAVVEIGHGHPSQTTRAKPDSNSPTRRSKLEERLLRVAHVGASRPRKAPSAYLFSG